MLTATGDYTATVSTSTASDRGTYDITLINSANYAGTGTTYSAQVEFTLTIIDPCETTVLEALVVNDVSV